MATVDLSGYAHPLGQRIDLHWTPPPRPRVDGVRLVRRERTHPADPDDGVTVAEGDGITAAVDDGLRGETVYYYALFASVDGRLDPTPIGRTSAAATARYDVAGQMYDLLPALYRRFDAAHGVLQRFLDLPGTQLDQLYSWATMARSVLDLDRVDGRLLPVIGQWIGWPTDRGAPVRAQRNEVRSAPEIYRSIGALPAGLAAVNRVVAGPARFKEYVHNVARTNQPARLNLWARVRDGDGAWGEPELLSVNAAHNGRAAHVADLDGADLLVFHTARHRRWDLWAKRRDAAGWQPSAPLVDRPGDDLHPTAARQGDRVWLFWEASDGGAAGAGAVRGEPRWRIRFRVRTAEGWSDPGVLGDEGTPSRRNPAAVVDDLGGLWLFWREREGTGWRIRFDRHDGDRWQLGGDPARMPDDDGTRVAVDDDLTALFHPTAGEGRLWLFWSRRAPTAGDQRRWEIAGRVKRDLDPAGADWSDVRAVPRSAPDVHDREPAPLVTATGDVELFWSGTRDGGWALLRSVLDVDTGTWAPAERIGDSDAAHRAPLAVAGPPGRTLLVYRSAESLAHAARRRILDARYAGSTTVRVDDDAALALLGRFEDVQTYTYRTGAGQAGGGPGGLAARDVLGVFLDTGPGPGATARLEAVLPDFLPAPVRPVVRLP